MVDIPSASQRSTMWSRWGQAITGCVLLVVMAFAATPAAGSETFRAGAAAVDITPVTFPVIVNGGFLERKANKVHWPLHARCLVLDDGTTRVAMAVVDTCVMPRDLIDRAKSLAHEATGIPVDRMLIAATHTHSAPSVLGALGTGVDEGYAKTLPAGIAKAIEQACTNLAPAEVGWTVVKDFEHTNCRRWIRRPDKVDVDPFGRRSVRAMMHPGYQNPDYLGPAGPVDPDLTILSVRAKAGRPIAMLSNYSMHYFGAPAVSSDYYGLYCDAFAGLIGADKLDPPFVAIMSQGTSGDLHWMDYSKPKRPLAIGAYAEQVARVAHGAWAEIDYHRHVPIAMREKRVTLRRRVPDEERLAWAKGILDKMAGRIPRNKAEVYAREQLLLAEQPTRELKLQALRIGDLGITAIPCEVYGLTGLRIKAQSPLVPTLNMELANGCEGYIPPPEQHTLGGYTTWEARTAALQVDAEPRIVDAMLGLLEDVAGKPRRAHVEPACPYAEAVLASKPLAYWRLGELTGSVAKDASGNGNDGVYEAGVALGLEGPRLTGLSSEDRVNRAPHLAGGRIKANLDKLPDTYTVELWFCNYLPTDARSVTGYLFSRGPDGDRDATGDHLGLGGTHVAQGMLLFYNGDALKDTLDGGTRIEPKTWHHVAMVRDGERVTVYLDGSATQEIRGTARTAGADRTGQVFIGGRNDRFSNFEGRLDEVAVYARALSADEIARHHAACDRRFSRRD